jgi:nucleoside-diphosphate-sugar epimerase
MKPQDELTKGDSKISFIEANLSDDTWHTKAKDFAPDTVIHTAWQIREMYGKKNLQWKWNISGSIAVFDFVFSTLSVRKFIHFSTVASYSALSSNTVDHFFTESEPFRKSDYLYAEEKRFAEERLISKYQNAKKAGNIVPQVFVVRPAAVTGPRGRYSRIRFGLQSALSGQLKGNFIYNTVSFLVSFTPITEKWLRQYIHEDDVVDIVTLLSFDNLKGDYEVFNICPPGPVVTGIDMAEAVGKRSVLVSPFVIGIVFFFMWHLTRGRIPTSKGGWKSYSYPIAVDGSKLTKMYGYKYKFQSKEAFVEKKGRYMEFVTPR